MVKRSGRLFQEASQYRRAPAALPLPCSNARLLHIAAPGVAPDDPKNAEPFVDGVVLTITWMVMYFRTLK